MNTYKYILKTKIKEKNREKTKLFKRMLALEGTIVEQCQAITSDKSFCFFFKKTHCLSTIILSLRRIYSNTSAKVLRYVH